MNSSLRRSLQRANTREILGGREAEHYVSWLNGLLNEIGFAQPNERGWRDLGSVRVAIFEDDNRFELIRFDGKPGYSACRWQISVTFSVPRAIAESLLLTTDAV